MPAPDSILKLCETFAEHREHFRSGNYNEFQLRKQLLDPLFEALGWDMANSQDLAPQYRDVIHEDAIKIGSHAKAPDYAFNLHGQRKFFLEAKKPSVNIKTDIAWCMDTFDGGTVMPVPWQKAYAEKVKELGGSIEIKEYPHDDHFSLPNHCAPSAREWLTGLF